MLFTFGIYNNFFFLLVNLLTVLPNVFFDFI